MHAPLTQPRRGNIVYPESDGKPMAENTLQYRWITVLQGNIAGLFREQQVFVAGDLFWYPVEGFPEIVTAPDVLVAFGRPKGERGSYKQWEEGDVAPQVVFEVLSPVNTIKEMDRKFDFYEEYGAEEYYYFDPDDNRLRVYIRSADSLLPVPRSRSYVSPRLGIRFDLSGAEMVVYGPDGEPFKCFEDVLAERNQERKLRKDAELRASDADLRASAAELRASDAEQRTSDAEQRASDAEQRVQRLRELTSRALAQQATPEELQELQHLLKAPRAS